METKYQPKKMYKTIGKVGTFLTGLALLACVEGCKNTNYSNHSTQDNKTRVVKLVPMPYDNETSAGETKRQNKSSDSFAPYSTGFSTEELKGMIPCREDLKKMYKNPKFWR